MTSFAFYFLFFSGTGSNPPGWKGWHLLIRFIVKYEPFKAPNRFMASNPYSEQVGKKRHEGGLNGLIAFL
ncbi:hypothetical protein SAMN05216389_102149 [Oceanobacillus limi]|uniref:Uncharacterized protein n=1 Tax=Oceanobacillus limi TaxID=930131 RepID=A0A1H9Z922_9BACI|nr:hypothetical protein SAMN05216389_102149 [Oceanobacillus limi]